MAKITIEEVSRQTGLSRGTVSRALNNRPDISEKTRNRVLDACRAMKYSPSFAARSLATGRSFALAVLLDDLNSVLAASFLRGVLTQAHSEHYAVHVAELGGDSAHQEEIVSALVNERIDGVLVGFPLAGPIAAAVIRAAEARPLVACAAVEKVACDVLMPDYAEAGRLAARHLLRHDNRDVLYVHVPGPTAADRLCGFQSVCIEHGLTPADVIVELAPDAPLSAATERMLIERLARTRAVAATDDFLALNLLDLCRRAGRAPGQDVAVMGQGNERAGACVSPRLSTVDFCGEEIGRRAAEMLLQRLNKTRQDAAQTTRVAPLLVPRESTRTLA